MVTIMPLRGEAMQRQAAGQDGFACDAETTGWVVSEGGAAKGYLLFNLDEPCISRLSCNDGQLADGLLKAAADFAFRAGIALLPCIDDRIENHAALRAAGFVRDNDRWTIKPDNVFRGCQKS